IGFDRAGTPTTTCRRRWRPNSASAARWRTRPTRLVLSRHGLRGLNHSCACAGAQPRGCPTVCPPNHRCTGALQHPPPPATGGLSKDAVAQRRLTRPAQRHMTRVPYPLPALAHPTGRRHLYANESNIVPDDGIVRTQLSRPLVRMSLHTKSCYQGDQEGSKSPAGSEVTATAELPSRRMT